QRTSTSKATKVRRCPGGARPAWSGRRRTTTPPPRAPGSAVRWCGWRCRAAGESRAQGTAPVGADDPRRAGRARRPRPVVRSVGAGADLLAVELLEGVVVGDGVAAAPALDGLDRGLRGLDRGLG